MLAWYLEEGVEDGSTPHLSGQTSPLPFSSAAAAHRRSTPTPGLPMVVSFFHLLCAVKGCGFLSFNAANVLCIGGECVRLEDR